MIPLEKTIVDYSKANRDSITPQQPMIVTARADVWKAGNQLTWIAEKITLSAQHGHNKFELGPITLKTDVLTEMEYDYYVRIFQVKAGILGYLLDRMDVSDDEDYEFEEDEDEMDLDE